MVNDQSFTFSNLLPYFKKSIIFTPPNYAKRGGPNLAYDASAFSSTGGPLHVSFWNYFIPVSSFFKVALLKLGLSENGGIQSGSLLGFAQYPATIHPDSQIRDSSETSFGQAAISSTSLQIYMRSLAKRIVFNGTVATGVTVDTAGALYTISARKEVILAAGPVSRNRAPKNSLLMDIQFRSPQLLMVSGIGPQDTLKSLNIPVIANLAGVGQNTWVSFHTYLPSSEICFGPVLRRRREKKKVLMAALHFSLP